MLLSCFCWSWLTSLSAYFDGHHHYNISANQSPVLPIWPITAQYSDIRWSVAVIRCWPLTIECLSTPTPYIGSNVPVSFIIRRLHCTGASKCKHRENWKQKPAPARAKSPAGRWEDSYQDCQGWSFHCSRISKPCLKWTCTLYSASLEKKEFWNGGWGFFDNTWQILGWETWAGQGRPASNINLSEADLDWHKSHSDL